MARDDKEIQEEIFRCYLGLSPENLWLDGEATQAQAAATAKKLTTRLKELFKELGRVVSEDESFRMRG